MSAPTAQELTPGTVLGAYRIERLIGAGGMSTVYYATHELLGRGAALKVLAPSAAADAGFGRRFVRESQLAAALDHPNVIPIYDAGEQDGHLYLAMRYVDGTSLDERVRRGGALEPADAVRIVEQIASALDAAHAAGLVHRDVKPSNVLLEGDRGRERIYLTDLGVAWQTSAPELTRSGEYIGTLEWLAPEQIQGKPLDPRTDVYALGAVLFFMLTGVKPFERENDVAVAYAHLSTPPPPLTTLAPNAPPALDAVVQRALAKEPSDRFPSAGALAAAARQAIERPAPPPPGAQAGPAARDGLRLRAGFEYVHEPLDSDGSGVPFLGNQSAVEALKERIRHSSGGAFLVTGFRGVGKTTIIRRALRELADEAPGGAEVVHVSLNIARPLSTEAMLFEVVRRLFEELDDGGVLASLPAELQRAVIVAYTRTSLSFKETRSSSKERSRGVGMSLEALPMVGRLGPSVDFSRKETDELATEAAFLAYSDSDVEHDFLRIVSLLRRDVVPGEPPPATGWRRIGQRFGLTPSRKPAPPWNGRLLVIVDELDKLTATEEGVDALEQILSGLKNLLTTRGVHFLFVAGPDLHDMALRESQRGSSVYESVFGWQLYVPCVWRAADDLLEAVLADDRGGTEQRGRDELRDYLAFKARGIPRLLLLELNSFVRWDEDGPVIALDPVDARRVEFYARLQRILRDFMDPREHGSAAFAIPIDEDRWRLGAYYVVDWILRCRDRAFTVDELVGSAQETPIDPALVLSAGKVRQLLDHLVDHGVLDQVTGRPDQTFIGDAPDANAIAYRVVDDIYEKLGRLERSSERERLDLAPVTNEGVIAPSQPWADRNALEVVGDGRYELRREIGRSSMGSVYRAYDRVRDRDVALKLLDVPGLLGDERVRARFLRAAEVAAKLKHPNLVPFLDTFEDPNGRLGIVLELVEGTPLALRLATGALDAHEAVRITLAILDALDYLHERGLARFDLKPSSILIDKESRPLISDVALAKVVDESVASARPRELTQVGVTIGTPRYMAPEQALGDAVDIRTDLHAVGLILFEMLTGRPALDDDNPVAAMVRIAQEEISVDDVPASPELRDVLRRVLAREPARRYADPAEMRSALLAVPEAAELDFEAATV